MRSASAARFCTCSLVQDRIFPPLMRLSGHRPSQEANAAALRNLDKSGPTQSKQCVNEQSVDTWNLGEVHSEDAIVLGAKVVVGLAGIHLGG